MNGREADTGWTERTVRSGTPPRHHVRVTYPPPPQQPDPYGPPPSQPYPPQQGHPQQYGQPPRPTRPPKKGNAGKTLLIVAAVVVVLCGAGIALFAIVGQAANKATNPTAVHAGMNQPARDGKFEFTVTRVQCGVPKVGADPLVKTAQGQFCLVSVKVANISTQPQTFDGSSQKAHDGAGATFGSDGEAEIYANSDTQTFLNDINPGNSVLGTLVFDVPKTAVIKTLELHDSPFSGGVIVTVA